MLNAGVKDPMLTVESGKRGKNIWVKISDNGPGIPEADRQRIFEPLFTTKARSLGLGLSTSKSIIEKLGGSLSLESNSDEGAAFTAFFPYRIPHDQT